MLDKEYGESPTDLSKVQEVLTSQSSSEEKANILLEVRCLSVFSRRVR